MCGCVCLGFIMCRCEYMWVCNVWMCVCVVFVMCVCMNFVMCGCVYVWVL